MASISASDKKSLAALVIFALLLLCLPCVVLASTTAQDLATQAITPYLAPSISLGDVQTAPMCGSLAAKTEGGAFFWVLSGKGKAMPFAVNGTARAMAPNLLLAPPTVSVSAVEKAFAGSSLQMPENYFRIMWAVFPKRIDEAAKAQGLPPLQAEGYYGRKLVCKSGQKAMVEMREVCGAVVEVQAIADCVKGSKDNDLTTGLALRVVTAVLSPDVPVEDRTKALGVAIEKAGKKSGEYVDFTRGKAAYKLIALKGDKTGEFRIRLKATAVQ